MSRFALSLRRSPPPVPWPTIAFHRLSVRNRPINQHGRECAPHYFIGDAPQEQSFEAAAAMGRDGNDVDILLAGNVEYGGGGRLGDDNVRLDAEGLGLQAFCHPIEIGLGFGDCF